LKRRLAEAARRFLTQPSEDIDRWVTLAGLDAEAVQQRVRILWANAKNARL
jgi:hypothetical protein